MHQGSASLIVLVLFQLCAYILPMSASPAARRAPAATEPSFADARESAGAHVGLNRRQGRGAQSNASGRYEAEARVAFDDGWQSLEELPAFETSVGIDAARKVITRPISPSIARSIPIAAASTAASTASPGRPTPIWGSRPDSISSPSCS